MKKIIACLAALMILTIGTVLAAGSTVGVVDLKEIVAKSQNVKGLQQQLEDKGKELSSQLDKEKPNLKPDQLKKKQDDAYREFLQKKQELDEQMLANIRKAAEQVAKEKKLSLILYKKSVAFGGVDVTQDIIQKMQ